MKVAMIGRKIMMILLVLMIGTVKFPAAAVDRQLLLNFSISAPSHPCWMYAHTPIAFYFPPTWYQVLTVVPEKANLDVNNGLYV